jgi:hypothetical protein
MNENKWIVVGRDMDGLTGYCVVHADDKRDLLSGCFWGGIIKDLSLNRKDMEKVAAELNAKNEPRPENIFRGIR